MPTKAWRKANPEKAAAQNERYRRKHREKLKAKCITYYAANKVACISRVRKSVAKKPEFYKAIHSDWKKRNKDKVNASTSKRRAIKRGLKEHHTAAEWNAVKAFFSFTCLMCLRCEPEIKLTRDHVVPIELGGSNKIDNIQPLCKSCNSKKHMTALDLRFM